MKISDKIIGGYRITEAAELLSIIKETPQEDLYEECHKITRRLCGDGFDTCAIINDKNGRCPEDCKWCAQSARHHTEINPTGCCRPRRWSLQRQRIESMACGDSPSYRAGSAPRMERC